MLVFRLLPTSGIRILSRSVNPLRIRSVGSSGRSHFDGRGAYLDSGPWGKFPFSRTEMYAAQCLSIQPLWARPFRITWPLPITAPLPVTVTIVTTGPQQLP